MKIYLAGPLFSTAEQEFNSRLKQHLIEYGHKVWLPQDESDEQTGEKAATEIFTKDVEGIDWADVVVANGWPGPGLWYVLGMRIRLSQKAGGDFPHRFSDRGRDRAL